MANSYRENYIYSGDDFSFYIAKAFCSWDYGITDKSAALLKHKSVYNELKVCVRSLSTLGINKHRNGMYQNKPEYTGMA